MGIVFIGPSGDVMRALGDKIQSKRMAEKAGVPVAPWSDGPVETIEEAREHAERIGFPLMIKAAAGGGGRGIRRVAAADELESALTASRREAQDAFGDGTRVHGAMVGNAHHIEVQLIADGQGAAWARRRARLLAASAATRRWSRSRPASCSPEQEEEVKEAARRLALQSGYRNAGTVEFLYEPEHERFSLHGGQRPPAGGAPGHRGGHRARPGQAPAPRRRRRHARGRAARAGRPCDRGAAERRGPRDGLRADAGPRRSCSTCRAARACASTAASPRATSIPPDFDSMVAKVIAHGRTRDEAHRPPAPGPAREHRR